jgi:hypothetical protein
VEQQGGVHGHHETLRLGEYSPAFDPRRVAADERFLVDDVRRWLATRFGVDVPRRCTAMVGALAIGLRHPDIFGAILCASSDAGYLPPATMPGAAPHPSQSR